MMLYTQRPCPTCDGQRQVLHRNWDDFHAVRRSYATPREYFEELGYLPGEVLPPLLVPCRACRGEGVTGVWAPLEDLLPQLLSALDHLRKGNKAA